MNKKITLLSGSTTQSDSRLSQILASKLPPFRKRCSRRVHSQQARQHQPAETPWISSGRDKFSANFAPAPCKTQPQTRARRIPIRQSPRRIAAVGSRKRQGDIHLGRARQKSPNSDVGA